MLQFSHSIAADDAKESEARLSLLPRLFLTHAGEEFRC